MSAASDGSGVTGSGALPVHNVHATAIVLDGVGVLIRGPSGAGKSILALELLDDWETRGRSATLVSDDRVDIAETADGLALGAPATIAGMVELRGRGIIRRPFVAEAPLHLVIDLVDTLERMPAEREFSTELFGVTVPRAPVPRSGVIESRHQHLLVREALLMIGSQPVHARQKTT